MSANSSAQSVLVFNERRRTVLSYSTDAFEASTGPPDRVLKRYSGALVVYRSGSMSRIANIRKRFAKCGIDCQGGIASSNSVVGSILQGSNASTSSAVFAFGNILRVWRQPADQLPTSAATATIQTAADAEPSPPTFDRAEADDNRQTTDIPEDALESSFKDVEFEAGEIYARHAAAAQSGDSYSQYVLFAVTEYCGESRAMSEAEIEAAGDSASTPEDAEFIRNHVRDRMKRCSSLPSDVRDNHRTLEDAWFTSARDAGHPLMRFASDDQPEDVQLHYLKSILREDFKEAFVKTEVYRRVASFYGRPGLEDMIRFSAWSLLACEATPDCEVSEDLSLLKREFPPQQYLEILRTAADFRVLIASGRTEEIEF